MNRMQDRQKCVFLQDMIDPRILDFIGEHHVLTVACVSRGSTDGVPELRASIRQASGPPKNCAANVAPL